MDLHLGRGKLNHEHHGQSQDFNIVAEVRYDAEGADITLTVGRLDGTKMTPADLTLPNAAAMMAASQQLQASAQALLDGFGVNVTGELQFADDNNDLTGLNGKTVPFAIKPGDPHPFTDHI